MTSIAGSRPETTYVETPQGHVAYQSFGQPSGNPDGDIVFITNALLNIDAVWDEPSAARFLDRLGNMGRVVMFNMLGSGVSDPIPDRSTWPPIETTVETVHIVLDAARMGRVRVEGGRICELWEIVDTGSGLRQLGVLGDQAIGLDEG